jgi:hypothetical protein
MPPDATPSNIEKRECKPESEVYPPQRRRVRCIFSNTSKLHPEHHHESRSLREFVVRHRDFFTIEAQSWKIAFYKKYLLCLGGVCGES